MARAVGSCIGKPSALIVRRRASVKATKTHGDGAGHYEQQ